MHTSLCELYLTKDLDSHYLLIFSILSVFAVFSIFQYTQFINIFILFCSIYTISGISIGFCIFSHFLYKSNTFNSHSVAFLIFIDFPSVHIIISVALFSVDLSVFLLYFNFYYNNTSHICYLFYNRHFYNSYINCLNCINLFLTFQ